MEKFYCSASTRDSVKIYPNQNLCKTYFKNTLKHDIVLTRNGIGYTKLAQLGNKTGKVLRQLIDEHGITVTELARRTGLVQPVVYRMASGETINPKIDTLIPLAKYFKITIDQLVGQNPDVVIAQQLKMGSEAIRLPILSWQEASRWPNITTKEKAQKYIYTNTVVSANSFALIIKDSAMSPNFPEHSVIIVDNQITPKNKQFAVVHVKKRKESICRQVLLDGNDIYLKPLNPDFSVIQLKKFDEYQFIGAVVEVIVNTKDIA